MARLAIKGHETRSKEVIEILEMLGGKNKYLKGTDTNLVYYINLGGNIDTSYTASTKHYKVFTLEEFLAKFPYKVGDKALMFYNKCTIIEAKWDGSIGEVVYTIKLDTSDEYVTTKLSNQLQPCKEETNTMDHTTEINLNHPCFEGCNEIELIIPKGWEFKRKDNKMFGVRKQPQYPKTYEKCCKIMGINPNYEICIREQNTDGKLSNIEYSQNMLKILDTFKKLLICRDAYWKIAGEEMGLDKPWDPWEPNYSDDSLKHYIYFYEKHISINSTISHYHILIFPSKKITEIFAENFTYLINECWQLLK
jgi:hypothetical protein